MTVANLQDFEPLARERMTQSAFDYVFGGAEDEVTLRENRRAFERFALRPRMLVDVSTIEMQTTALGTPISFPAMIAPTAFQILAHPEGERAMARAAERSGTIMIASTLASTRLEDIAAETEGPKWFQLYCYRERAVTEGLVRLAEESGYEAICLTVDVPRIGRRERDIRNEFSIPAAAVPRNFESFVDLTSIPGDDFHSHLHAYVASLLDGGLEWDTVDWLRSITSLPILIKGIMTAEDAVLAREHGASAIVVSNHGGRQLDGTLATIEVLEEVVDAAGSDVEIFVDGGVRRGTDIVKALALGARAVLVGRPCVWALATDGADGAHLAMEMLKTEFELAMALTGCPTVDAVTRAHVVRQITD
jgi:isopentenyl diphosphate isomerase/L-lactate dehydrogenase-like FMN-dependent dehydrogenase